MPRSSRAPAGARAVARSVERLVDRVGITEAAALLDRSPRTIERIVRASVRDEPLGRIIPSRAALERWQTRLEDAGAVTRRDLTPAEFRGLQRRQEALEWRLSLQTYRRRGEALARTADYLSAGVPGDLVRVVRVPGGWKIGKAKTSPGRRRRR